MNKYYCIYWTHNFPDHPVTFFYEVAPDNAVLRMVEVFHDGKSMEDSLELAAEREPNIVNNKCLCDGAFELPDDDNEFESLTVDQSLFEDAYESASPQTS